MTDPHRCLWCGTDPLYVSYHDTEWGVPERDSRALWENLMLEAFQAGLSWITILRRRENFRRAFAGFDPAVIATWGEAEVARLLADPGIIRHRGKIEGTIRSARAWLQIEARGGFSPWLWRHVDGTPLQNHFATLAEIPGSTPLSAQIAKDLRQAGFSFCGPTITYAFLQASGLVNDHLTTCHCHARLAGP